MKEGSPFNKVSLMFLRKNIFKNFDGGGENRKEPRSQQKRLKTAPKTLYLIYL